MNIRFLGFGRLEVEGVEYDYDLVIERGEVRKRHKGPSKAYRHEFGHTPLSAEELLPWHGGKLYIGTGTYGRLPIMPEVHAEAKRRGVELVALPTEALCRELVRYQREEINAVLHLTC